MIICLTGTIKPPKNIKNLKMKDENERLRNYIDNILFLITQTSVNKIVFCESSNSKKKLINFLYDLSDLYWKKFEYLTFLWNSEKVVLNWRWFWEQEILEYIVNNSILLKWEKSFYKLTGRYLVKNIEEIINKEEQKDNIFIKISPFDNRCSTAFFKVNVNFFKKFFFGIWDSINDELWEYKQIEWIYKNILSKNRWKFSSFSILPIFEAKTWSGYILKQSFFKDILKQLLNFLWFYKL